MSTLVVEVCQVSEIKKHPNADRMAIAVVKGWETCVRYDPKTKKAEFEVGEKCIYFPPDAILPGKLAHAPYKTCKNKECKNFNKPVEVSPDIAAMVMAVNTLTKLADAISPIRHDADDPNAEAKTPEEAINALPCPLCGKGIEWKNGTPGRLDVMAYLAQLPCNSDGVRPDGGRVKAARLRGSQSFGFIMKIDPAWGDDPNWPVGTDVADHYGITKWEPPPESNDGEAATPNPRFYKYTDIEHYANFPDVIFDGEEVVITEKLHGKNCRVGYILTPADQSGVPIWEVMAGSHDVRRKEYVTFPGDTKWERFVKWFKKTFLFNKTVKYKNDRTVRSDYWMPVKEKTTNLLIDIASGLEWPEPKNSIIVYGEIYGSGVQDMAYGMNNGTKSFRVFDIAVNGKYLDYDVKQQFCERHGVEMVPLLYRGPFTAQVIQEFTSGPTTMCKPEEAGNFKGREGVVITPVKERFSDKLGRVILKSVSADYLDRKGGTDGH